MSNKDKPTSIYDALVAVQRHVNEERARRVAEMAKEITNTEVDEGLIDLLRCQRQFFDAVKGDLHAYAPSMLVCSADMTAVSMVAPLPMRWATSMAFATSTTNILPATWRRACAWLAACTR